MADLEWFEQNQRRSLELLQAVGGSEEPCPLCKEVKNISMPWVIMPWLPPTPPEPFQPGGMCVMPLVCCKCGHVRFIYANKLAAINKQIEAKEG